MRCYRYETPDPNSYSKKSRANKSLKRTFQANQLRQPPQISSAIKLAAGNSPCGILRQTPLCQWHQPFFFIQLPSKRAASSIPLFPVPAGQSAASPNYHQIADMLPRFCPVRSVELSVNRREFKPFVLNGFASKRWVGSFALITTGAGQLPIPTIAVAFFGKERDLTTTMSRSGTFCKPSPKYPALPVEDVARSRWSSPTSDAKA